MRNAANSSTILALFSAGLSAMAVATALVGVIGVCRRADGITGVGAGLGFEGTDLDSLCVGFTGAGAGVGFMGAGSGAGFTGAGGTSCGCIGSSACALLSSNLNAHFNLSSMMVGTAFHNVVSFSFLVSQSSSPFTKLRKIL